MCDRDAALRSASTLDPLPNGMPSHLSSIGFHVADQGELSELVGRTSARARRIRCTAGSYLVWSSSCGAELWLHEEKGGDVVGLTPFFRGGAKIRIAPTHFIERPTDNAFEGALHAWANPVDAKPGIGDYPFVFDLVNIATLERPALPAVVDATINAFAYEMQAFESEASYKQAQGDGVRF